MVYTSAEVCGLYLDGGVWFFNGHINCFLCLLAVLGQVINLPPVFLALHSSAATAHPVFVLHVTFGILFWLHLFHCD